MHPDYVSDRPGDCPICGMRLVPASELAGEEMPTASMEGMEEGARAEHMPHGLAPVRIPPTRQQLIGVKTAPVRRAQVHKSIRTVGRIDYDETRLTYVNLKFSGWVEELAADYTGKRVEKGDLLMVVYSPQLIQAQEEYLQALSNGDEELTRRARSKLLLWGVRPDQLQQIEENGVLYAFPIYSPVGGYIVEKTALEGKHFKAGENLFVIADLSTVWVYADIYEYELPFVQVGAMAHVTLPYLPGQTFMGHVSYIYPQVNERTRTIQVRMAFPNPDLKLKPGMYATVEIFAPPSVALAIPKEAVIRTGERDYVFVKKGAGTFEPRLVTLGPEFDDHYAVLEGLSEGEEVVVSASFLIDSESRLKAAISGMSSGHSH